VSRKFVAGIGDLNAGPSTPFAAKNAANSAQDDGVFVTAQDDRVFLTALDDSICEMKFRPGTHATLIPMLQEV
jgi:hypothetical protein